MSIPPAWPEGLDFFGTPLVIEPSPGQLCSDAGLLPIRQFDQRIGLTRTFADAFADPPRPRPHGAHVPGDGPVPGLRHPGLVGRQGRR